MALIFNTLRDRGITNLLWEDLCHEIVSNNTLPIRRNSIVEDISTNTWMTSQLLKNLLSLFQIYCTNNETNKAISGVLRPEDATNVPQLRIDHETGTIIDWNRSMTDLTGVARSQVVGQTYESILRKWVPFLSDAYRTAATNWIMWPEDNPMIVNDIQCGDYETGDYRKQYLFPLPLPLKHSGSDISNNVLDFIELLVAKTDQFSSLQYPTNESYNNVNIFNRDNVTKGWVGGLEFTLRRLRKGPVPSLQLLCQAIVSQNPIDADGSLLSSSLESTTNQASILEISSIDDKDVFDVISEYISSNRPEILKYIREVLYHVRISTRKCVVNKKIHTFSEDWSNNSKTSKLHTIVFNCLGGEKILEQNSKGGKITWRLAFSMGGSNTSRANKRLAEIKRDNWISTWKAFLCRLCPVIGEHSHPICLASDVPYVIPAIEYPENAILTLKIEGMKQTFGSDNDELTKAWVNVCVPATLNFFQLHRIVCQAMHCDNNCTQETHVWKAKKVFCDNDTHTSEFDYVQLGETYFVENGTRVEDNDSYFGKGIALRQRVSHTAAYFDHVAPLNSQNNMFLCWTIENLRACIHSTCISAIFFQPSTFVYLEDGHSSCCTKYKISCMRIDEYDTNNGLDPLPKNRNMNVMQSKCLRGKSDESFNPNWSVDRANSQLELDRGCLRRKLCKLNSKDCMQQMPWCYSPDYRFNSTSSPITPLATKLFGADFRPIFLYGEPPLPQSSSAADYGRYVSSLYGRIDPGFLQDNIMQVIRFSFHIPFKKGRRHTDESEIESDYDDDDNECVGAVWEREVDEEMRQIENNQSEKKSKIRRQKRKAED